MMSGDAKQGQRKGSVVGWPNFGLSKVGANKK